MSKDAFIKSLKRSLSSTMSRVKSKKGDAEHAVKQFFEHHKSTMDSYNLTEADIMSPGQSGKPNIGYWTITLGGNLNLKPI